VKIDSSRCTTTSAWSADRAAVGVARKFAPEVPSRAPRDPRQRRADGSPDALGGAGTGRAGRVTISSATLHNEEIIAQKDIRVGDWVEIVRAGEVIPQVIGPLRDRRDGSEAEFAMPGDCPVCGTPVDRPADEVVRYCPNVSCPGRVLEGIVHFASREAMDIRGLGYERVRQLLDAKLIADVADL
jgi:DNA ligase (NAD+)